MNNKLTTPGLVIREKPSGENNSLLTVLTATNGLVTATAYGARKNGATLSSGTRLFNYSEFTFIENRGRYKVDSVRSLEQFFALSYSVEALAAASYFAELLYNVSVMDEADTGVLRLALNALYSLCREKLPLGLIKAAFELRLMSITGFEPELDACVSCGGEAGFFSITDAGIYCERCAAPRYAANDLIYPLSPSSRDAMRYIVSADMPRLFSFTVGDESVDNLCMICESYAREQTGRSYDSLEIYHSLVDE